MFFYERIKNVVVITLMFFFSRLNGVSTKCCQAKKEAGVKYLHQKLSGTIAEELRSNFTV